MNVTMFTMVVTGIVATFLGVGFGCLVLELTVRALKHTLSQEPVTASGHIERRLAVGLTTVPGSRR
jgi:hypothetical protein